MLNLLLFLRMGLFIINYTTSCYKNNFKQYEWSYILVIYSVLVSVSCPKALYNLETDNIFRITLRLVVADWLS